MFGRSVLRRPAGQPSFIVPERVLLPCAWLGCTADGGGCGKRRDKRVPMQTWEKPSFTLVSLGAEVTAYLGSDTDATPV